MTEYIAPHPGYPNVKGKWRYSRGFGYVLVTQAHEERNVQVSETQYDRVREHILKAINRCHHCALACIACSVALSAAALSVAQPVRSGIAAGAIIAAGFGVFPLLLAIRLKVKLTTLNAIEELDRKYTQETGS